MKILVERGVERREIEVRSSATTKSKASIPGEIVPHREFYDYTAKYLEQGTRLVIPAPLTKKQVSSFRIWPCARFAPSTAQAWRAATSSSKSAPGKSSSTN